MFAALMMTISAASAFTGTAAEYKTPVRIGLAYGTSATESVSFSAEGGFTVTVEEYAEEPASLDINELVFSVSDNALHASTLFGAEIAAAGIDHKYEVGTMIEIPRAALTADRVASSAEFFSFGTNDLTQMTFGYSRDDIASFLPVYLEKKILKVDPFQVLDQNGVGQLVRMATEKGRAIRPDLKCGICGEHGGEPSSVKFCHRVGLNYVSCSPFRVPIARLAAAQAAIEG